jgi:tetratricopeptide (TPR) repeat protein
MMVFAKNSIGKEFTYFDEKITIIPPGTKPHLTKPILGYKTDMQPGNFFYPYKNKEKKLYVDTENTFKLEENPYLLVGVSNINEELWKNGRLELNLNGLSERVKFNKKYVLPLKDYDYKNNLNVLYKLGEEGLNSDYYELNIKLINKHGIVLDSKGAEFTISPFKNFSYPMETFKKSRLDNPYYFYNIIANQYESAGNLENAEKYYEKCLENKPEYYEGFARYLNLLNKRKKYTKVLVEVENLKKDKNFSFEYHLIKGTAFYGMKDYEKALKELVNANEKYDSDIRVLNLLGFTFLNLKDYKEALKAFNASLGINDTQSHIKETIEQVKEKIGLK